MIRVLIADDVAVIRAGVRAILSRADVEVIEATDGAEAVAKALQCKPDLVVLDLTMPVMGGYEAALELRGLPPKFRCSSSQFTTAGYSDALRKKWVHGDFSTRVTLAMP